MHRYVKGFSPFICSAAAVLLRSRQGQGVQSLHQHLVAVWIDCDTVRDSDRLRNLHTQH
eukprot:COSAG04_NODE_16651_length_492_cov_2.984733_1_plen_58_part_10